MGAYIALPDPLTGSRVSVVPRRGWEEGRRVGEGKGEGKGRERKEYRHFGPRTLRTQNTSDLPKFGPRTLQHDQSVPTLVPRITLKCLTDTSALESLSTYSEDQSHCILCKGLSVNSRESL